MERKLKILVILGPTASGKSALAVTLARKLGGEIVSADSRQVYKGLDIGTGKITRREMKGIPHHLLDVANPKKQFTVAEYKKLAEKVIDDIVARGKLPIICGGTGFYIQAIVDGTVLPEVAPNVRLRARLEKKSAIELFKILKKLDPRRAKEIDKNNPRRLVRAIEIAKALGSVPIVQHRVLHKYEVVQIGIKLSDAELKKRITIRLLERIRKYMIDEAKQLHKNGLSWKRMEALGLEYRYLAAYLQREISREEMISKLKTEIWHYAKRQMTWFKRDKRIRWQKIKQTNKVDKSYLLF
ncbi:MAG: tRNA (adenosine(37)-N6)-dimethylallyltransferase MiaA [Candidatus Pacebacteria bacterium]|nr:tRNA (adenosine(37)-N6)-dimethylallyltransferase MiaA [Candidatus Paceibacterota bacterium]